MTTQTPYPFATGDLNSVRASIAQELSRHWAELGNVKAEKQRRFSISSIIGELDTGGLKSRGFEREICSAAAAASGQNLDAYHPIVPWTALFDHRDLVWAGIFGQRDQTVGSDAGGGYLRATDTLPTAADVLRPWSVTASAGLRFIENLQGNLSIPKASTAPEGEWVATEASAPTPGAAVLGQVAFVPKIWVGTLRLSRLFVKQGGQRADEYVRTQMLRACARALDVAVLNGPGTAAPVGLLVNSNVASVSGTALSHAGTTAIQRTLTASGLDDQRMTWIAAPTVREALQSREIVSTAGKMVWAEDRVLNRPAYATSDMPAASLIAGDFSQCAAALWGSGPQLELAHANASDFRSDILTLRVLLAADVNTLQSSAFIKSTTVS